MRIDFSAIAEQQAQIQIMAAVEKHPELLEKLKSASQQGKRLVIQAQPAQIYSSDGIVSLGSSSNKAPSQNRELLFSDEDGIEVFEVDGDKADVPHDVTLQKPRKVRPNDPCVCGSGKKSKKCCGQDQE
jgi:hypothetical protein